MLERSPRENVLTGTPPASLTVRRLLFFLAVVLTMAGLIWLAVIALSPSGFGAVDLALVLLFAVTLPWYVIGFWNATIGLLIMRFARDPVAAVTPAVGRIRGDEPITTSTAIVMCIRNELPDRVLRHLTPLMQGIAARGAGDRFHVYVLSDTDDPAIAAAEDTCFAALAGEWQDKLAVTYRRRDKNTGFKAGNVRDFCERWGHDHDFALMLDADSVMTADAALRLVRVMQVDPQIGILQSLVIGMPSASAFARIFQFGMRLGMRSYTIGSAWWQGDCGPYWGHNALVRIAPFVEHCHLPMLAEGALVGGHVLSHDQIEAVLMRRAGYEVRVVADEGDSFEQNPPTLVEYIRRDLRWCQGNMQYWHFLRLPGLRPMSRYQLDFRDPDVRRRAGLDRDAADRQRGRGAGAGAGRFHARRRRAAAAAAGAVDVVCAKYRDRHRRHDPPRPAADLWRRRALHAQRTDHDRIRDPAVVRAMGEPYGVSGSPAHWRQHRLGRTGARRPFLVLGRCRPILLAADLNRGGSGPASCGDRTIGHSIRSLHRRRPALIDSVRGTHLAPRGRTRADRHRA